MTGGWEDFGDLGGWEDLSGFGGWEGTGGTGGLDGLDGLDGLSGLEPLGAAGVPDDHLLLDVGGVRYGLPASHDLGDGAQEDAVTLTDDRGMAVCADTDGDGHVDRLSVVGFDGSWSHWERVADPDGPWTDGPGVPASADPGVPATEEVPGGASAERTPPVTPARPAEKWRVCEWECVQRGEWG